MEGATIYTWHEYVAQWPFEVRRIFTENPVFRLNV